MINVLIHYNSMINVANDMIGGGNRKVNVKINALEKGSFIVNIELVASVVKTLFSPDSLSYLADLVGVVGGAYALYATFKGKPVKKEDARINIENVNIAINDTTINVYNNQTVREAISKSIVTISDDLTVESVEIGNSAGEFAKFRREEFNDLIYDDFSAEDEGPDEKNL